jgi:UDP-2,3-diacylglucosamine pyrophosphatase LpxH
VIYVTGNHDEFLRRYSKLILGNIQLVDEAVHVTADGRHLLVIHGDQFDVITAITAGWPFSATRPTNSP